MRRQIRNFLVVALVGALNLRMHDGKLVQPEEDIAKFTVAIGQEVGGELSTCTGILIEPQVVLTAAHCFYTICQKNSRCTYNPAPSAFFFGVDIQSEDGTLVRTSKKVKIHPDYEKTREAQGDLNINDLALVHLDSPAPSHTKVILPSEEPLDVTKVETLQLAGYGLEDFNPRTGETKGEFGRLKKIEVPVAFEYYGLVAVNATTSGACKGDSGGPVFIGSEGRYKLVGLSSLTLFNDPTRACRQAGTVLPIDIHRQWISDTIKSF